MNKYIFLFVLVLCFSGRAFSQLKVYDTFFTDPDISLDSYQGQDQTIISDEDGVFVASTAINSNNNHRGLYYARHSTNGNIIWNKYYEFPNSLNVDHIEHVLKDNSGYYILGKYDLNAFMILKLDLNGSILWSNQYLLNEPGPSNFADITDAIIDSDGNLVVGGVITGGYDQSGTPLRDPFITKITISGQHLWTQRYFKNNGESLLQSIAAITENSNGYGVLLTFYSGTESGIYQEITEVDKLGNIVNGKLKIFDSPNTAGNPHELQDMVYQPINKSYYICGSYSGFNTISNPYEYTDLIKVPEGLNQIDWWKVYNSYFHLSSLADMNLVDGDILMSGASNSGSPNTKFQFIIRTSINGDLIYFNKFTDVEYSPLVHSTYNGEIWTFTNKCYNSDKYRIQKLNALGHSCLPFDSQNSTWNLTDYSWQIESLNNHNQLVNTVPLNITYTSLDHNVVVECQQDCENLVSGWIEDDQGNVINNTVQICDGESFVLTAEGVTSGSMPFSYQWSNGSTSQDITVDESGTYTVYILDGDNCLVSASVEVEVLQKPKVQIVTYAPNLCSNDAPILLDAIPQGGTWSGPGIISNNFFDPSNAGFGNHVLTYSYVGMNGCANSDQMNIVVADPPNVVAHQPVLNICCGDGNITLGAEYTPTGNVYFTNNFFSPADGWPAQGQPHQPIGGQFTNLPCGTFTTTGPWTPNIKSYKFDPCACGPGSYPVEYTYLDNETGCSASAEMTIEVCTGSKKDPIQQGGSGELTSISELADLTIYPNPTNDQITIELPDSEKDIQLNIYSTTGQLVYSQTTHNSIERIDLSMVEKGIYLVVANGDFGSITKKVIKE